MNNEKSGNFDPGAMIFGNFINYYQFHPPEERVKLITDEIWQQLVSDNGESDVLCLDVGCNCGDLTESSYKVLLSNLRKTSTALCNAKTKTEHFDTKEVKILGLDIDVTLIDRANEKNKFENNIKYKCLDIMKPHALDYLNEYLLEENIPRVKTSVVSKAAGSTKELCRNSSSTIVLEGEKEVRKFRIIFCFSVTMWIHLNHGDKGLYEFLDKITALGKYLVMENQPWKCYRNAQRRIVKNSSKEKKRTEDFAQKTAENLNVGESELSLGDIKTKTLNNTDQPMRNVRKIVLDSEIPSETNNVISKKACEREIGRKDKGNTGKDQVSDKNVKVKDGINDKIGRRKEDNIKEEGFKHYRELKLRSNVEKEIDAYVREKCHAEKIYESEENEWGRVITVYVIE